MNLAAVLGSWLSLSLNLGMAANCPQDQTQAVSPPAPQSQTSPPAPASAAPKAPSPNQAKSSAEHPRHRKKTAAPACSNNPTPSDANSQSLPPCPPPKKVVRNGGSNEPNVQFTAGDTAQQAAQQRSTDQLKSATEENLKKIAGRQLAPSQQETVTQINQFLEQSKSAIAEGDLERGHNLALKAQLLSEELVKP